MSTGLPSTVTVSSSMFRDTGATIDTGNYLRTSCFAWIEVITSASTCDVEMYCTNTSPPNYETVVHIQDVTSNTWVNAYAQANGVTNSGIVILPGTPVSRRLRFYNGTQVNALGTWQRRLHFSNAASVIANTTPASRLIIYGDSIPISSLDGTQSPIIARDCAVGKLRTTLSNTRITDVGFGGRGWTSDASDPTSLYAEIVNAASDASSNVTVLVQVGFNDYWLQQWADENAYAASLASLFPALRTRLPSARIAFQTIGTVGGAVNTNGLGQTAAAWRTAQTNTFNAWADGNKVLIDGTTMYAASDLLDNIHPKPSGATVYSANLISALGLT